MSRENNDITANLPPEIQSEITDYLPLEDKKRQLFHARVWGSIFKSGVDQATVCGRLSQVYGSDIQDIVLIGNDIQHLGHGRGDKVSLKRPCYLLCRLKVLPVKPGSSTPNFTRDQLEKADIFHPFSFPSENDWPRWFIGKMDHPKSLYFETSNVHLILHEPWVDEFLGLGVHSSTVMSFQSLLIQKARFEWTRYELPTPLNACIQCEIYSDSEEWDIYIQFPHESRDRKDFYESFAAIVYSIFLKQ